MATLRGPVRRSYTAAKVLRQLSAARVLSPAVNSNCTSFSASAKVLVETSGPNAGPAPKAGGAPAGGAVGSCDGAATCFFGIAAAPIRPIEVVAIKSLRDGDRPVMMVVPLRATL